MKKTIMAALILVSFSILISCGGNTKGEKKNDQKKDSVTVEAKPVVKDFKYFDKLASNLKLEGLELTSANAYTDTASHSFNHGFNIKDAKDKGADMVMINAGSINRLAKISDVVCASLSDFEKLQTARYKGIQGVTTSDFKEWKKDDITVYYLTIKGMSDQMGGQKNYNQLYASYVKDDVYLDIIVRVNDNKADLAKAEQILIKALEYVTK